MKWKVETSIHAIVVLGGVLLTGILPIVIIFGFIRIVTV